MSWFSWAGPSFSSAAAAVVREAGPRPGERERGPGRRLCRLQEETTAGASSRGLETPGRGVSAVLSCGSPGGRGGRLDRNPQKG